MGKIERISNRKRNDDIKYYEDVEIKKEAGIKIKIYVNFNNHKGFFKYKQILDFDECSLTYNQLSKRIKNMQNEIGSFYTIKDAISRCNKGQDDNAAIDKKGLEKRQDILEKQRQENKWFNNFMVNIMKVGSLHNEALIIQGKDLSGRRMHTLS